MSDRQTLNARWNLPGLRKSTYAVPDTLLERRRASRAVPGVAQAGDVAVRQESLGGIPCVVCEPAGSRGTALYFHGGGYRLGSASDSAAFGSRLANSARLTVVVVDYRLAPEHPFPAGLADGVAVYDDLLGRSERPLLIGDSAGGGLAASLTVAASGCGRPMPTAMILMSPWLDLSCTAGTFTSRQVTDQLFSRAAAQEAAAMYLQGHDPRDPLASPLHADLERWPPTLLMASTEEVLLDDSIAFAGELARARTDLTCWFRAGVPHAWPAVFPDLPDSRAALATIQGFTEPRIAAPTADPAADSSGTW